MLVVYSQAISQAVTVLVVYKKWAISQAVTVLVVYKKKDFCASSVDKKSYWNLNVGAEDRILPPPPPRRGIRSRSSGAYWSFLYARPLEYGIVENAMNYDILHIKLE